MPAQKIINNSIYNVDQYAHECLNDIGVSNDSIIVFIKKMPSAYAEEGMLNLSEFDTFVFEIYIDEALSYSMFLKVLAHELVHIKQFYKNEFVETKTKYSIRYKRKMNYADKYEDEANSIGAELFNKFKNIR